MSGNYKKVVKMKNDLYKILALTPYPIDDASSRYRIFQFIQPMLKHNISISVHSIITSRVYKNRTSGKGMRILDYSSLFCQIFIRFYLVIFSKADVIILSRDFMPVFRRQMHWIFAKIIHTPVIFDFDDAVFVNFPIDELLLASVAITPGNQYLADYAKNINPRSNIQVIPTVVDTDYYKPQSESKVVTGPIIIGWIGSESTYKYYLMPKLDFLVTIAQQYQARVHIVGPITIQQDVISKGAVFLEWSLSTERDYIAAFHIGIMPLFDDRFTRGKCAFKIIEYGAFGIPSIASKVGANETVILQGETGFLVDSDLDWEIALKHLLTSPKLRAIMGSKARDHVKSRYSLESQVSVWVQLIQVVVTQSKTGKV
jgi:glycosyltransferase involved in cell wall biosynthesis